MAHGERDLRREGGQALILMVLAMTIIFAVFAVVLDFGLWISERRGAQKDADASALAGAYELLGQDFVNLGNNNFAAVKAAAEQAVYDWAALNGVDQADIHGQLPNNVIVDDTDCLGPSPFVDTVYPAAEHHSQTLFTSIFGLSVPEIGAPAKACLGSASIATGLLPIGIQIESTQEVNGCWKDVDGDGLMDPLYGQECVLTFGAGDQTSGEAGRLRLYDSQSFTCSASTTGGSRTFSQEITGGGADTTCHVYKYFPDLTRCGSDPGGCVYPLTGVGSNPERDAFEKLLSGEGACDQKYKDPLNGIDDFLEVLAVASGPPPPSPTTLFGARDCDSPRLVSLIIIRQFTQQGNGPAPIEAFAAFYIKGCEVKDNQGIITFSAKCQFGNQAGLFRVRGNFVNFLDDEASGVGQISKWSPKRIILTE